MNLKAKRLVRTPYSEQYALFDLDRTDENFDPLSVGKLDIHYTQHGIYGTFLFWEEACEYRSWEDIVEEAEILMAEFQAPMGVPGEYAIEFFSPSLKKYDLLSNIDSGEDNEPTDQDDDFSDSDEFPEDENEEESADYHSIWPLPALQSVFDEPEDDKYGVESYETEINEEDWPPRLSRHSGIHDQLEWTDKE